jgi:hypothetical protein
VSSIKHIKPISDEMKMLFSLANQVEQRWLGILGSLQGRQSVGGM